MRKLKSEISNFKFQISNRKSQISNLKLSAMPPSLARRANRAFTLVELLVVITIIGILAGLISVAAVNAVYTAKQMRIKAEVDQLDMALKAFKQQYGDYPPCDLRITSTTTSNPRLRAFVAKAFPRYNQANLHTDLATAGVDTVNFDPARALVFWLSGFNPDVTHPFTSSTDTTVAYTGERTKGYDFDRTRLLAAGTANVAAPTVQPGGMWYTPAGGMNAPFVYFDYRSYTSNSSNAQPSTPMQFTNSAFQGNAQPYALDVDNSRVIETAAGTADTWANPETFQIIAAGQDGNFGLDFATAPASNTSNAKGYPAGYRYVTEDNDNVSNFADKSSLEDAKP
jgi:prepilin-type N-terminal cleavage/methylation domain-containing protein